NYYDQLWSAIRGFAYKNTDTAKRYNPSTCSELYNNGWVKTVDSDPSQNLNARPFIINIRQLHNPTLANLANVIKYNHDASGDRTNGTAGPFTEAETYPRILYNGATTEDLYTQTQIGNNTIYRVEGLYVIAVEGQSVNVDPASVTGTSAPAYYDFYIRSCWMPTNSDRPSTISTLVRLYDPAVIPHT
ncbi:MAG: hypothetical protein Q4F56_03135, partial [Candidatus Saccharibacteria bacterium]|nr:hypothetical protein [Candidatus Saccharibacteria bacterium]